MLRRAGYGPILRREIPPTLLHLTSPEIVPSELTPEQVTAAGPIDSQKYDRTRLQVIRSNQQRKLQLTECMRGIRTQLHAMIEIAMRERAPLRFDALEASHPEKDDKGNIIPHVYDGVGMIAAIVKLAGHVGLLDDPRDHDREIERMRDSVLPDGCMAQEYSDKVNTLVRDHLDHLERPLAGVNLGRFLILMMPRANAAEGRIILRELTASKQLDDRGEVVRRCMQVMRQSETPEAKAAAVAVTVQRRQLMALGPNAAPMAAAIAKLMAMPSANANAIAAAAAAAAGAPPNVNAKRSRAEKRAARVAAAAATSAAPATADTRTQRAGTRERSAARLPEGTKCWEGFCSYDHARNPCYRSPFIKEFPAHVESNTKMVARIEVDRKDNCANARPPIAYKPVPLRTTPAGVAAVGIASGAIAGPAGEIGGLVPNELAQLMLMPSCAAAPIDGGVTMNAAALAALCRDDPQCADCSSDESEQAAPMSAGVPLTTSNLAALAMTDPQYGSSTDSDSEAGMPVLLHPDVSSDDSDSTTSHVAASMLHQVQTPPDPALALPAVPMGSPVMLSIGEKRARVGALSPCQKVSDIDAEIRNIGLVVSPRVGGSGGTGPKGGRTKSDIINDALAEVQKSDGAPPGVLVCNTRAA